MLGVLLFWNSEYECQKTKFYHIIEKDVVIHLQSWLHLEKKKETTTHFNVLETCIRKWGIRLLYLFVKQHGNHYKPVEIMDQNQAAN